MENPLNLLMNPKSIATIGAGNNIMKMGTLHALSIVKTGYNGKFTFNLAAQHKDNLYFGINLNSHFINYDKYTAFYEDNSNDSALVNNVFFENRLSTNGYRVYLRR